MCAGAVRFGPLAGGGDVERYMMIVPATWSRESCTSFFQAFAGPAGAGARGAAVRFGCLFADEPQMVWETDPNFATRNCGW